MPRNFDPKQLDILGDGDESVNVGPGHDTFASAKQAAKQGAEAKAKAQEEEERFNTEVEGAVKNILERPDLDKLKAEATGELDLQQKMANWRKGIAPDVQDKLGKLREQYGKKPEGAPRGEGQQPANQPPAAQQTPDRVGGGKVTTPKAEESKAPETEDPKTQAPPDPKQPRFNPFTGEPLKEGEQVKFDPITGEPIDKTGNTVTMTAEEILAKIREEVKRDSESTITKELEELRQMRGDLEKERQELIAERDRQKELRRQEQEEKQFLHFQYAAKQALIPEDVVSYAYARALEIAGDPQHNRNLNARDPEARIMPLGEVFEVMQKTNPSFFKTKQPAAPENGSGEGGDGQLRIAPKAGTGTGKGGGAPTTGALANTGAPKEGHDDFASARKALTARLQKRAPA
jgi:hypothetical protein